MPPKTSSDLRAQAGQLLIVGFDGTEMSPQLDLLLTKIQPAGVILFARNISSAEATRGLLRSCQSRAVSPLFTCVDMEGGRVDRFRSVLGPAPSAADVFATGDRKLFRKHGRVIGHCCRALGFNTDLAPVVDLAFESSRKVMSSRAVSADPKKVVLYAREFLAGLHSAGVLGAAKHFPGLGEANLDTHHELPSVNKPWKKLWEQDIYPYRTMRRELAMVLVSHVNYSSVTRDITPASLSKKWISEVLRKKIGYRGLVLSDDLEMGGVLAAGPIEHVAIQHIRAGGDLCLICHQENLITRAYEALIKEAEKDPKFAERVAESSGRVLRFKQKSKETQRRIPAQKPLKPEKLSRILWEFGEQVRMKIIERQAER
jgi:beta-N-acetylhexosaminidase